MISRDDIRNIKKSNEMLREVTPGQEMVKAATVCHENYLLVKKVYEYLKKY